MLLGITLYSGKVLLVATLYSGEKLKAIYW